MSVSPSVRIYSMISIAGTIGNRYGDMNVIKEFLRSRNSSVRYQVHESK